MSNVNAITQTQNTDTVMYVAKFEKPETLDSGMVSFTYSMESAECHWMKMQKEKFLGNTL